MLACKKGGHPLTLFDSRCPGAHIPWTPRGVAQAWRVAAPQHPWQWNQEGQYDEPDYSSEQGDSDGHEAFLDADAGAEEQSGHSPKLTLAQSAAGMSVYSVVYAVVLAHSAAQRFVRAMLYSAASWAGSPFRVAMAASAAAVELCWRAKAAPLRTDEELAQLSQQHRERLLRRDGVLHEAPLHSSDDLELTPASAHSSLMTTPVTSSSSQYALFLLCLARAPTAWSSLAPRLPLRAPLTRPASFCLPPLQLALAPPRCAAPLMPASIH